MYPSLIVRDTYPEREPLNREEPIIFPVCFRIIELK